MTESDRTLVVWTGAFDAPPESMADERTGTTGVYTAGLDGLRARFD